MPRMSQGDPSQWSDPVGPFQADQIRDGDRYELSNGHAIHCMTTGGRHSGANYAGSSVLGSDPAVESAGIDTGITFNDGKNLRAPDVVVNVDLRASGWVGQTPPLIVEYADTGQDHAELARKIAEFLELGTRFIWVVHLVGPLRVEVHEPGRPVRIVPGDGELTAPGVLQNPVPVRALIDPKAAHEATLINLLNREGYPSIEAILQKGREQGREEGVAVGTEKATAAALETARQHLCAQLAARGWTLAPSLSARITACRDHSTLLKWLLASVTADSAESTLR